MRVAALEFPDDAAFTSSSFRNPIQSVRSSLPDRQPATKNIVAQDNFRTWLGTQSSPDRFFVGHAIHGDQPAKQDAYSSCPVVVRVRRFVPNRSRRSRPAAAVESAPLRLPSAIASATRPLPTWLA